MNTRAATFVGALLLVGSLPAAEPVVVKLWPGKPPGDVKELGPERDTTKETDNKIAGKRLMRITDVSSPEIAVYKPDANVDTGAAVIVCPGGGHNILAYDLEGTEVAQWLTTIGVTGIVLKYRVPFRDPNARGKAALQDGQRATRIVRSRAKEWGVDPDRIGVLGFSAGGQTAGLTAIRHASAEYEPVDGTDKISARPNFAILVYPAYLANKEETALVDEAKVDATTPPMFLVHTQDDGVTAASSLLLALALKKSKVACETHVYSKGGHGYGLRETHDPVTRWPKACEAWLKTGGWLKKGE